MNSSIFSGVAGAAVRRGLCRRTISFLFIGLLAIGFGEAIAFEHAGKPMNKNAAMSYAEARKTVTQLWENQKPESSTYHYDKLTVTFIGKDKVEFYRSIISSRAGGRSFKYTYNLTGMSDPYIKTRDFWHNFHGYKIEVDEGLQYESSTGWNEKHNMIPIIFPIKSEAEAFAEALSVLKKYAIKEKEKIVSEASSFVEFQQKAQAWRQLKAKPELPPEVRRYRLLAEDAIRHREFEKAIDYYEQGLAIEPLWPQGQYNAALLYAEMKEYRDAELHMKRYLELVPDAPDAQAARDQMIIWQSRMEKENAFRR